VVVQNGGLSRLDSNGQNPVVLTSGSQDDEPHFSPAGTDVIFSRVSESDSADIYRVQLDGSGLTNLTPGFEPAALDPEYSPSGNRIAFSAEVEPGVFNLYVMNADGSGITEVTSGLQVDRHPSFSPDGLVLVFERGPRIATVDIASGTVNVLTDGSSVDSQPRYCPPGEILFIRDGDVWSLEGGTLSRITDTPNESEFVAAHIPGVNTILFLAAPTSVRFQSTGDSGLEGDVYTSAADGAGRERVTNGLGASHLTVGPATAGATNKNTFTLNIENSSPYSADQVYVQIQGQNEPPAGDPSAVFWYYLANPGDSSLTPFDREPSELLKKEANGAFVGNGKYFFTLADMTAAGTNTYTMEVPRENLYSGRIYVSFGQSLPGIGINAPGYAFTTDSGGAPSGSGTPVLQSVTGTGTTDATGLLVDKLSIDTSTQIYPGEPVSGTGIPANTVVSKVLGSKIELSQAAPKSSSVTLSFNPPPFTGKALQGPSFTGSPDFLIPWEFMELSATRDATQADPWYTLFCNTSVVDFYSIGLGMDVEFTDNTKRSVGFVDGSRDTILKEFNDLPEVHKGFKGFVVTQIPDSIPADKKSNPLFDTKVPDVKKILRVLGPQNILQFKPQTDPFHSYLAPVVDAAWIEYQSTVLDIPDNLPGHEPYGFKYTGKKIVGDILTMTCSAVAGGQSGLGEVYNLSKPSTFVIFKCDDTKGGNDSYANDGSAAHKRLASLLLAALNRGVFADYLSWSNSKNGMETFYKSQSGLYNHYPEILHRYAIDNKVYGFGYDDIYGQDPTIAGSIGQTEGGQDPPGGPGISKVTVKLPSFPKF
jgi:glycosyl hydrolase family 64 (putative beta-1,3-glucanase)/WD40 repeat protein